MLSQFYKLKISKSFWKVDLISGGPGSGNLEVVSTEKYIVSDIATSQKPPETPENLCGKFENEITSKAWYSLDEKNADKYYTAVGVGFWKKLAANVAVGTEFKGL